MLWTRQSPEVSHYEEDPIINILDSNTGNSSKNSGIVPDPNFKPSFKQIFDPKTSTITAFLIIYKNAMFQAPEKIKREHILTCLHPSCQEIAVA